jgi:superfamily II DNA helicase RecQ
VYRGETRDNLWGKAIEKVKNVFGIPSLQAEQEEALRQFFSNQDVFVNLPTSFGKSLIFQATPIMADVLLRRSEGTCISFAQVFCVFLI